MNDSFDDDALETSLFKQALAQAGVRRLAQKHHNRAALVPQAKTDALAQRARRMAATRSDNDHTHSRTSDGRVEPVAPGQPLFFALSDLPERMLDQLKKGKYEWQAGLDLHGYTLDEARAELETFLQDALSSRHRCVLIVHGKAWGGVADYPVIKSHVNAWLRELPEVIAFCSARPIDGGTGAVYVLLKKPPRS